MNGWSRSRVERSLEAEDRAIEAMVELAKWLSHDFAEADIVVRPHPFESPELYQKALEGLANVSVDGDGPVQPRILGAVAVVQRSCTTAIEAGLAGVPALSPQWVPAPTVNPMSEAVSERCQTYADLKTRVRSILDATHRPSAALCTEIQTVVHDWFHRNDGRAHERVADTVARCWSGKRVVDEGLCRRYQYGLGVSPVSPVVRLGQWTRYAVGLSPNFSFRQLSRVRSRQKRVKDFGAEDALRLARRIESAQRAGGRDWRPVSVEAAADRGDYSNGFVGQSVTVACEP